MSDDRVSRRDFISGVAGAAATFTIVPGYVLGAKARKADTAPSDKLNVACIAVGGKGWGDTLAVGGQNIVAICDVDAKQLARAAKKFPKAKAYKDYRRMLEKHAKQIDAVTVSTPDHHHAVASLMAIRMGKHVFCQKPLARTIQECRMMAQEARKHKVATQMGNQGHASEGLRLTCEWIQAGAIGQIREIHAWSNRPIWPQGIARPKETPPAPKHLSWDLWLGPAPQRPYHPCYVPFKWRGWWDFGTGACGDMACHMIDAAFTALKLGAPVTVEPQSGPVNDETGPKWSIVSYHFAARGEMPPVKLIWYDGGRKPPRPAELEKDRKLQKGGILYVGDKGKMLASGSSAAPRIIPETKMKAFERPPKTLPRSIGHVKEWLAACKGGKPAGSNFDYAGALTETTLLANVAIRTGRKIEWDAKEMKATNVPEAEKYVKGTYRKGWRI